MLGCNGYLYDSLTWWLAIGSHRSGNLCWSCLVHFWSMKWQLSPFVFPCCPNCKLGIFLAQ